MKPARRADFERWYAEQVASNRVFNLQAERSNTASRTSGS